MKKRTIGIIGILVCLGLLASSATASNADWGTISGLYAMSNGAILFSTSGTRTSPLPACQGAGLEHRYAIDASTTAGQALASVLVNAYDLHKRVWVSGTGTCTIWGDTETVNYIQVED